jgi:cell division septation protein DedD
VPELDFSKVAQEREEFGVTLMTGERVVLPKILDTYAVIEIMGERTLDEVKALPDEKQNMIGIQMLKAILGEDNFRKCINGIPRENQGAFAKQVFEYYGVNEKVEEEEGKAPAEEAPQAPLSPSPTEKSTITSDTSTPISSASTPQPGGSSTQEDSTSESSLHGLAPSPLSRSL